MAASDRYVVTMETNWTYITGAPGINVFAYTQTLGTGNAFTLWGELAAQVTPAIAAIISNLCAIRDVSIINLDDPSDFYVGDVNDVGTRTGDPLPQFCAWYFDYLRTTRTVKNGRKSFGIVAEADWTGASPAAGITASISNLQTILGGDISDGAVTNTWSPRIWRRAGTYGNPPVAWSDTFFPVAGVVFRTVGSQNSRKK